MNPLEPVFVDSVYLIAVVIPNDQWRDAALAAVRAIGRRPLVTSDGVVLELLAHVARESDDVRMRAVSAVQRLRSDRNVTVVEHTGELMERSLELYGGEFRFSSLSLQDCVAIEIMRRFGITEILTADQEFALAGVTPLLRRYA